MTILTDKSALFQLRLATPLLNLFDIVSCGQSYNGSMIVNYNSTGIPD